MLNEPFAQSTATVDSAPRIVRSPEEWLRLLLMLFAIFLLFHWSARALGSDTGQAGLAVGALVVAATLIAERLWSKVPVATIARSLGLGPSHRRGLLASATVSALLLLTIPAYARATGTQWTVELESAWMVAGLFAQAGVAEETLFRGYLFGHLRRGRSFWRAASLAMLPFVAVHLLLFLTMPWPVALAALVLAVILSFPFAYLFELGGSTIWAPALLHFVVQGTVKIVSMAEASSAFPLAWMAASALVPMLVFLFPRPATRASNRP